MNCKGLHCGGCGSSSGSSGGGGAALAALILIVACAALARPVARAAAAVLHVAAEVLEIACIVLASAAGAGLLACAAVAVVRVRRRMLTRPRRVRAYVIDAGRPDGLTAARNEVPALTCGNVSAFSRDHMTPHVVTRQHTRPRCREGGPR
jgi:hypothetical protein